MDGWCSLESVAWTDSTDMVKPGWEVVEAHGDSPSMLVHGLEAGRTGCGGIGAWRPHGWSRAWHGWGDPTAK